MNKTDLPGLYIHVPFCKSKCPYCDFYSTIETGLVDGWLSACLAEAGIYRDRFDTFDSLYLGGGTPSLLSPGEIERLITGVRDVFPFHESTEATVELNPDDVTEEKLAVYRSLGINRVSLGVQSFAEEEVRFLGRRHTARQAVQAVEAIGKAGFGEFSIDLMYGLPGQSMETWLNTLKKAVSFCPDHVSCYQLTVEGNTAFSRLAKEGKLGLPDDSDAADFFVRTSGYLGESGFIHYEVSNFARGEKKLARHNVKYWQHTPYLGLGPSAHSFLKDERWWNVRSVDKYAECLNNSRTPVDGSENLTLTQMNLERLLFASRTMWGIDVREISPPPSQERIRRLCDSGFIMFRGQRIVPTTKGYLFADKLPVMIS